MKKGEIEADELFIIKKMIEGDIDAFRYFFDAYYSDLCNFVNSYVNNQSVSEEIVQDIFVYFWEKRERLSIKTSVRSYLFSASKFRGLNHLRNTRKREAVHNVLRSEEGSEDEISGELDEEVLRDILNKAIEALPPKCYQIFKLSQDYDVTNREIADKLGISVKAVENQITIAYKKLHSFLQPYKKQIFLLFIANLLS